MESISYRACTYINNVGPMLKSSKEKRFKKIRVDFPILYHILVRKYYFLKIIITFYLSCNLTVFCSFLLSLLF